MAEFLYQKKVPIREEVEVLVVGGGPAGIAAAVASARNGAKTLLIERYGVLGGNATVSLVGPFMTSYSEDGSTQLAKGLFEELVTRMEAIGGAIHPRNVRRRTAYSGFRIVGHDHVTPFEPEAMKRVATEMVNEANVRLKLHTFFTDVIVEESKVVGIVTTSKSGLEAIKSKVTIDCDGDGDVAFLAGAPFEKGRKQDGLTQPMTMFFRMGNIDDEKIEAYQRTHPEEGECLFSTIIEEKRKTGEWNIARDKILMFKMLTPGVWRFNITRILKMDGTNVNDLTKAEEEGRKQVYHLVDFFHKYVPGLEKAFLIDTAIQVGVRDTRRIVGEYTLTIEDLVKPAQFDDVVGLNGYPVDIHDPDDIHGGCTDKYHTANSYEIPYRILVPIKLDNLLVAGRCVSSSFEALGAIRIMPTCMIMGQAAGTAAAISVANNITPRKIDVKELQKKLLAQNVYLGRRFE